MDGIRFASMYADAVEIIKKYAKEKGLNQTELARRANTSVAQVSRVLSFKSTASEENLINLAIAVGYPPDGILRVAGKLPTEVSIDEVTRAAVHLMADMDKEDREEILEYVRMRHKRAQDHNKLQSSKSRRSRNAPAVSS